MARDPYGANSESAFGEIFDPVNFLGFGGSGGDDRLNQNLNTKTATEDTTKLNHSVSQTQIDPEGMKYLLESILGSNNGLAAVSAGANSAGVYNSATETLLQNDLIARAAGEVAARNSKTVTDSTESSQTDKSETGSKVGGASSALGVIGQGAALTVVCTQLHKSGVLNSALYYNAAKHSAKYSAYTMRGYHWWAIPYVHLMRRNDSIGKIANWAITKLVVDRARHIAGQRNLMGYISQYILQPMNYCIGRFFISEHKDYKQLYSKSSAVCGE